MDFDAVEFARRTTGRFCAQVSEIISEVCYLQNPKNLLLCALLTAMCVSLFACGYAGTPPGFKTNPNPTTPAPTITQQPASQSVTAGQAATFSVTATGDLPLSY